MDHGYIEEHGLVARYHRGDLTPDEEERFEAHFMECARCQEELEVERSFARGMKRVAAEDAARSAVRLGLLAWLARRGLGVALAAAVVLVAAVGFGHLLRENQRLQTRLAELTPGDAGELATPLADVPLLLLGVVRSSDEPAVVTDPGGPWSLAVDAGADPRFESYAVTILDAAAPAEDAIRFERAGLRPNDLEVIHLTFPTGFLDPGDYRLLLSGTLPGGDTVELGDYPFRVVEGS